MSVRWQDGITLYTATYFIEGSVVGRGPDAYKKLLETIEKLPDGSTFGVAAPVDLVDAILSADGDYDELPFRGREAEKREYDALCLRKKLSVTFSTFAPKEFLGPQ